MTDGNDHDMYFSVDVEADGPIPGVYSMLALGMAVAGEFDGQRFTAADPHERTFYRELKPVSDQIDAEALAVSRLDRDKLVAEGADPAHAMTEAAAWVRSEAGARRPVFVGYPVVFDWMFMHWYFVRYAGDSPFGFSNALDIKTIYQQKAQVTVGGAGRDDLPDTLKSATRHTHNALDDAIEQADIFARLFIWPGAAAERTE
jgi:hypothetical protein